MKQLQNKKKKTLNHGFTLQLYYNFNIVIIIFNSPHVIIITSLRLNSNNGESHIDFILMSMHEIQLSIDLLHEPECLVYLFKLIYE